MFVGSMRYALMEDWYTKILLDTPLARLVTIDPSVEVIERDLTLLRDGARGRDLALVKLFLDTAT